MQNYDEARVLPPHKSFFVGIFPASQRIGRGRNGGRLAIHNKLIAFVAEHLVWAEPIVFAISFAESIVLVSLAVPSSILLIGLGAVYSAAGGSFWSLWLAAAAGAFLGDVTTFVLGRRLKRGFRRMWPLSRYPRLYARAYLFFQRWGLLSVIGGKFLGQLRPFVPAVAGAVRMPWPSFLFASASSSMVWAAACLAPGYGLVKFW